MKKIAHYDRVLSSLLALYIVFLPFEEALASTFGSLLKLLGFAIIIYCFLVVFRRTEIKFNQLHICLALWITLSVLSFSWANSFSWWSYFIRIYIGQIVFFFALSIIPVWRFNLRWMRLGMIIGAVLASLIVIIFPTNMVLTEEGRRTIIIFNSTLDPNIVCALMALGIFSLLSHLLDMIKEKRSTIFEIATLMIILMGVFITGSRGGFIAISVSFILWLILNMRNNMEWKYVVRLMGLSIITVLLVLHFLPENLLQLRFSLNSLLGLNEIQTEAHSRYKIWSYTWEMFKQRPILGYGSGNFFDAIATVYREAASHNMYILILIENGIIGLMVFLTALYWTLRRLLRYREYNTYAMFISILIICIALDGITYKFFWIAWIYAYLEIQTKWSLPCESENSA